MGHLRWRLESAVATAQRPLNLETATRLRRRVEALAQEVETGSFTGVERSTLCRLRHQAIQTAELAIRRADTA